MTVLAGVAVASSVALSPAPSQQAPAFRSGVELIEIDVVAIDRSGAPARGLTRDDFEITEHDRLQEIQTFAAVDLSVSTRVPESAVESDVMTNRLPEGRLYVLLLDAASGRRPQSDLLREGYAYTMRVKQVAQQFVDTAMQPGDEVAVVHVQGTFADSQPFTTSRQLIHASVERYGRGLSGNDSQGNRDPLTRNLDTYRTIEDLAARLGSIRGRRKAIIWIGGQIETAPERTGTAASAATLTVAYRDAIRAAARHNVAIYPVDPTGATPELGMDEVLRMSGLRDVAEDTGGLALVNTNNFTAGFETIMRDLSTYYVLGYSSPDQTRKEVTFTPVRVRVKRPGVTVRARRGYYSGASRGGPQPSSASLPKGVSAAAADALARPLSTRGLPIDVATTAFRTNRREHLVVVSARIDTSTLQLHSGESLAVAYQIFNLEGRAITGAFKVFGLNLQEDTRASARAGGFTFVERLQLRPGRYELRLVAEQPGVALGSVVATLAVPSLDEPLAMSRVLLETATGDPTVRRRFRSNERMTAFAEIYTSSRAAGSDVRVSATIAQPSGNIARRIAVAPVAARGETVGRGFRAVLDFSGFADGPYLLTFEVRSRAQGGRVATHAIPFDIAN